MMSEGNTSPILIGGDGRSGTTLLAAVLDAHPDLAVGPELHFRGPPNLGPLMLRGLELMSAGDERMTSSGVGKEPELGPSLRFIRRARRFGVSEDQLYRLVEEAMRDTESDLVEFAERCRLVELMGNAVAREYGKTRWGAKVMREVRATRSYLDVWPGAAVIHIVRDGRDVAASQVRDHSSWGYKSVEEAAAKWSRLVARVGELSEEGLVHELRYEDLVTEPERTLRAVLEFIGAPWSSSVLAHEQVARVGESGVSHASAAAVEKPLETSSIGRYKQDLSRDETEAFCRNAEAALRRHGYLGDSSH